MPELICRNIMFIISIYAVDLCDSVICLSSQEQETVDLKETNCNNYKKFTTYEPPSLTY